MLRDSAVEDGASRYEKHDTCEISIEVTGSLLLDGENDVSDVTYYTAGVPLLVLLMPRALDHLRTVPLRTPPHSSQLLTEFASVRWNGPGQLTVPPQSSLSYFRAIGATTSPVRTYCSR